MKKVTLFIMTFIIVNVYGQQNQNTNNSIAVKKFQIGINFSPDICYRTLKNNNGSTNSNIVIDSRNSNETYKFACSGGLNVIYNFNKNLGIETGIQFANKGYQTKVNNFTYGEAIDPKYGFVYISAGNQAGEFKLISNYYYLDIPVKLNYMFGKRKIRFITSAGITTNIFIKEKTKMIINYSDGTNTVTTQPSNYDYNKINLTPFISAGIDYAINNKMNIRVEPTVRYGALKIIDAPVTAYLYDCGLNFSYYLSF